MQQAFIFSADDVRKINDTLIQQRAISAQLRGGHTEKYPIPNIAITPKQINDAFAMARKMMID